MDQDEPHVSVGGLLSLGSFGFYFWKSIFDMNEAIMKWFDEVVNSDKENEN